MVSLHIGCTVMGKRGRGGMGGKLFFLPQSQLGTAQKAEEPAECEPWC